MITKTEDAQTTLANFATSTSAVSAAMATSGKIIKDTQSTAKRLSQLENELEQIVSTSNNEKNKLSQSVKQISQQIDDAKTVILKTSELSLEMEKKIEERMAGILKLVRTK